MSIPREYGESLPTVLVYGGDDAAPEAVAAAMRVLRELDPPISFNEFHGTTIEELREQVDASDAVFFGAASGGISRDLLEYLRWGKQTYANIRPIQRFPNTVTPLISNEVFDYVIVRENLEDTYAGIEGALAELPPELLGSGRAALGPHDDGTFAIKVATVRQTERIVRTAFQICRTRLEQSVGRGELVVGTKANVLPVADGIFLEMTQLVAEEYPDIAWRGLLADDLARRLVSSPDEFDVILLPNLYGDILSDVSAATVGGLGMLPSACLGNDFAYFEPAHGTAPDIAGQGSINPTAQILSAAMMLDYLGLDTESQHIRTAVGNVYLNAEYLTGDVGGTAGTNEFTDAVIAQLGIQITQAKQERTSNV